MLYKAFSCLLRPVVAVGSVLVLAVLTLAVPGDVAFAEGANTPTIDAEQAALEDGTIERTNPFPELLPDEEAQKFFDQEEKKGRKAPFYYKIVLERDGKFLKPSHRYFLFQPGDVLRMLIVTNESKKTGVSEIGNQVGFVGLQRNHTVGPDGIPRVKSNWMGARYVYLKSKVLLNGKPWKRYEDAGMWKNLIPGSTSMGLSTDFTWPRIDHLQYIEHQVKIPAGVELVRNYGWEGPQRGWDRYIVEGITLGSAKFTPVDDFAYREAAGLEVTPEAPVELPARSAGKPAFDDAAFRPLPQLQPLGDAKVSLGLPSINMPLLRGPEFPPYLQYDIDLSKQNKDPNDVDFPDVELGNAEDRPTLEDLTGREFPGYVYVSNDIDQVSYDKDGYLKDQSTDGDNGRISYAIDPDSNFPSAAKLPPDRPAFVEDLTGEDYLTDKYYYVTYRQIPAPVKVLKVDDQGKVLPGACFTLNKLVNKKPVEVATDLCAPENGVVLPAAELNAEQIKDFVKHNNPVDATHSLYKTKQGGYLLAPGEYSLVETTVPEGYEKAEDAEFAVKLQKEAEVKTVEVKVVNSLQPTPTPTPTPTPAPTPTPTPTPAPSGPGLSSTGVSPVAGLVAFGLLLVGGGFVGLASRRRL